MQRNLMEIEEKANASLASLEVINGQMLFFDGLIRDIERNPEIIASLIKEGSVQRKLIAIYMLLHDNLSDIESAVDTISKAAGQGENHGSNA
ncbi:hypothetical protein [Oceanobacillus timonensis]|uniref:hypothetical protein n=1 Tax=Oceanobacillus timonensis TaxID=1926285 RepID=UPI0009B9BCA9|nr:hypothetical protein [Oceanobacillus timonensis]